MRLGLDIGFGDVKAVADDGRRVLFPTAVAPCREASADLRSVRGLAQGVPTYEYGGTVYRVGADAVKDSTPTRSIDFLVRYAPLLAGVAFRALGSRPEEVCVGLDVNHFSRPEHRDCLERALSCFRVNGEEYRQRVWVVPQGAGVLVDWLKTVTGARRDPSQTEGDGLILDIGFHTVDAVAFSNRAIDREATHCFEAGVSRIVQELRSLLQRDFGYLPAFQKAKEIFLAKALSLHGQEHGLQDRIARLTEAYFEDLLLTVQDQWGKRLAEYRWLILAGGGAYALRSHLAGRFAQQAVHMPEPEFSNARGFLKILLNGGETAAGTRKP